MVTETQVLRPSHPATRSTVKSLLLTLPILFWSLLMFSRSFSQPQREVKIAGALNGLNRTDFHLRCTPVEHGELCEEDVHQHLTANFVEERSRMRLHCW
jgi:hypothetical protein